MIPPGVRQGKEFGGLSEKKDDIGCCFQFYNLVQAPPTLSLSSL